MKLMASDNPEKIVEISLPKYDKQLVIGMDIYMSWGTDKDKMQDINMTHVSIKPTIVSQTPSTYATTPKTVYATHRALYGPPCMNRPTPPPVVKKEYSDSDENYRNFKNLFGGNNG